LIKHSRSKHNHPQTHEVRIYCKRGKSPPIISHCEKGKWVLVSSGAIDFELSKLPDIDRFEQIQTLYAVASNRIKLTEQAEKRAAFFQQNGIKPLDSLHLALAETDKVDNPVSWLMEVMNNE
jgi:hypothetical protein